MEGVHPFLLLSLALALFIVLQDKGYIRPFHIASLILSVLTTCELQATKNVALDLNSKEVFSITTM
jgi:hypothetical protein